MGLYDEIEPTLEAFQAIKTLPSDQPIIVLSLMRLRLDLADGRADAAWRLYQGGILPILQEFGAKRITQSPIALQLIGPRGQWDYVGAFWYPNPRILWRFLSDERVLDLIKIRRKAVDDVNMMILQDCHDQFRFD
ncbi:hypothetical protein [Candidatus Phycosocius spiralis]|uniref:DUF1330 domain-containing protein n=1 Tax=Candidatus Phycosocius spiralis TaxID=2815099 RepID=A0ABQ4PVM4_9PROT|nr:hypothetical protein [Candidatus Phycosocius spiralis]GIU67033.1 hypothetical protein PsB1_1187 [Candidatus Phycosocius spiralis]